MLLRILIVAFFATVQLTSVIGGTEESRFSSVIGKRNSDKDNLLSPLYDSLIKETSSLWQTASSESSASTAPAKTNKTDSKFKLESLLKSSHWFSPLLDKESAPVDLSVLGTMLRSIREEGDSSGTQTEASDSGPSIISTVFGGVKDVVSAKKQIVANVFNVFKEALTDLPPPPTLNVKPEVHVHSTSTPPETPTGGYGAPAPETPSGGYGVPATQDKPPAQSNLPDHWDLWAASYYRKYPEWTPWNSPPPDLSLVKSTIRGIVGAGIWKKRIIHEALRGKAELVPLIIRIKKNTAKAALEQIARVDKSPIFVILRVVKNAVLQGKSKLVYYLFKKADLKKMLFKRFFEKVTNTVKSLPAPPLPPLPKLPTFKPMPTTTDKPSGGGGYDGGGGYTSGWSGSGSHSHEGDVSSGGYGYSSSMSAHYNSPLFSSSPSSSSHHDDDAHHHSHGFDASQHGHSSIVLSSIDLTTDKPQTDFLQQPSDDMPWYAAYNVPPTRHHLQSTQPKWTKSPRSPEVVSYSHPSSFNTPEVTYASPPAPMYPRFTSLLKSYPIL